MRFLDGFLTAGWHIMKHLFWWVSSASPLWT